jgi:hypothetical protein
MAGTKNPTVRQLEQRVAELEAELTKFQLDVIPFLIDVAFSAARESVTNPQKFAASRPARGPRHLVAVAADPERSGK